MRTAVMIETVVTVMNTTTMIANTVDREGLQIKRIPMWLASAPEGPPSARRGTCQPKKNTLLRTRSVDHDESEIQALYAKDVEGVNDVNNVFYISDK
jgi:hypothetical protein